MRMATQDIMKSKSKMGRPATGVGTPVMVRLSADQLAALDAWIAKQSKPITRPEAIRAFVAEGLAAKLSEHG
jgi:cytochrome c553